MLKWKLLSEDKINLHKREPVRVVISSNRGSVWFFSGATRAFAMTKGEFVPSQVLAAAP